MAAIPQQEDDVARWRRNNGLSRVERVPRDTQFLPHPSHGGSRGYDIPFRQMMLEYHNAGRPVPLSLMRSVRRWARNLIPRRMTGNKSRSELSGNYLFLLVLFKMTWPHSSYYECIAFIANETNDAKIFNEMAISRALRKLGYTTKITSTVAYQVAVETGDPAIPAGQIGSVSNPRVWGRVNTVAGTSAQAYCAFVSHVLDTYDAVADPAVRRTLIHDNLSSHKAPEVYEAIRTREHRVVCRPPYRPQDGPVEYAINQVCCGLVRRWSEVSDLPTMQTLVEELIDTGITGMDALFVKCGYIWN